MLSGIPCVGIPCGDMSVSRGMLWFMPKASSIDPSDARLRRAAGKAVRSLREEHMPRMMSQEALALESDVNRGYLSALELGKHDPGLWMLWRLKTALGITLTRLVREIETQYNKATPAK